ncbi:hypothetical protein [Novosphingobium resinovorum]|uniref:hypothetical protein n=1 Tax=Novosphingobium resinovorum TaxID=158500 RepID=UPI002ED24464|nr:hypothetical protein [Novosphingobium resinovorum]
MSEDELPLLAWIAAAQRVAIGRWRLPRHELAPVIAQCAETLGANDLHLAPFKLYANRLRVPG